MRRIVGTIMAVGGILVAPPLWTELALGGVRAKILFAGAVASIGAGLILSLQGKSAAGDNQIPD